MHLSEISDELPDLDSLNMRLPQSVEEFNAMVNHPVMSKRRGLEMADEFGMTDSDESEVREKFTREILRLNGADPELCTRGDLHRSPSIDVLLDMLQKTNHLFESGLSDHIHTKSRILF
ncbi:MAG: hypothetical protein EB015_20755, partial [Methylocystaceae bacterium]|nr:hypothetical protein [Methylocystaceae bacterium]